MASKRKNLSSRHGVQPDASALKTASSNTSLARRRAFGLGLVLTGLVLLSYRPALNGGMLWDDDGHVTKAALRSWEGLGRIWFELGATQQYYPLLHSAFWVEHRVLSAAVRSPCLRG